MLPLQVLLFLSDVEEGGETAFPSVCGLPGWPTWPANILLHHMAAPLPGP